MAGVAGRGGLRGFISDPARRAATSTLERKWIG
jgi:hypothetical protein